MDSEALKAVQANPESVVRYVARQRLITYARYLKPKLEITNFHKVYYEVLDRFAHKQIKRLIISAPPQSGKSEGSSRVLPSFILGLDPDRKIVIGSYSTDQAKTFNRDVQRIVNSEAYKAVFPDTFFNNGKVRMDNVYQCNSEISEPVGHSGFVRAVGRNGSLTGKTVDVAILDDVYKDFNEANSKLIREQAWKWYTTVVEPVSTTIVKRLLCSPVGTRTILLADWSRAGRRLLPSNPSPTLTISPRAHGCR